MRISPERLATEAEATGFQPEVLEKSYNLLGLLDAIDSHPFLRGRLALKGGTALNLFVFDVPRLSVDIDLNYVGAVGTEEMMEERPLIEEALQAVFSRENYTIRRMPEEHAGGKWSLRYTAGSGGNAGIEVDVNYMYRLPLWPLVRASSRSLGSWEFIEFPLVDVHKLAAGKLAALFARQRARDLFDCSLILSIDTLDLEKLRIAFVVYGAMNRKDWRTICLDDLGFDPVELSSQLMPALRVDGRGDRSPTGYGESLLEECRRALSAILPFTDTEREFLDRLLEGGKISPELLTADTALQERIGRQPLLEWKALNVRRYRGLS